MAVPHTSEFSDFQSNYDKVNRIDTPTHTQRKVYQKDYWLVFPSKNFTIKFQETRPLLTCFLKTKGEQFGDAITPLNISDLTVKFKCVDIDENMIIQDTANIIDTALGEIAYEFKDLDFPKPGRYYGEFEFTISNLDPSPSFTLPATSQSRIEIIVS
jgi:hypothetical protein